LKYQLFLWLTLLLFFSNKTKAQQHVPGIRNEDKKSKYSIEQFIGRWQETDRLNSKTNAKVEVIDTFYIRFYEDNKAETKQGNFVTITGTSELVKDEITTSANDFKIISVKPEEIILDDNFGYVHILKRTNLFAYEISKSPPAVVVDDAKETINLSATRLVKEWYTYKTESKPGSVAPETPVIRKLNIVGKTGDNNYKGEVMFSRNGNAFVQGCTLTFSNNYVTIVTEKANWNLEVYKSDGKEIVMGKKGTLVYHLKNDN
jgi:hypothetical protein